MQISNSGCSYEQHITEKEKRLHRCCFTGHRPEKLYRPESEIKLELKKEICRALEDNFTVFISGMARDVDIWAAEIVLQLRKDGVPVRLICACPYPGFERNWSSSWQTRYTAILKEADLVRFISPCYSSRCFQVRNEWMVKHSSNIIAVFNGQPSGTKNTIEMPINRVYQFIKLRGKYMKKTALILAIVIILSVIIYATLPVPEPERCSLCDSFPRHAPCILKLSTGELVELEIYDPHPYKVAEIAEEQPGGYFSFVRGAGLDGHVVAAEFLSATIPVKAERMNKEYFCSDCRELLNDYKRCGYVLADVRDPEASVLYPIEEGISFSLRCYEVEIGKNEEDYKYELMVRGTFNK